MKTIWSVIVPALFALQEPASERKFPVLPDEADPSSVRFSIDGKTIAYRVAHGKKWFVVVGDTKGEEFDDVKDLVVSPDCKTVGYAAKAGKKWLMVIGATKGPEYFGVSDLVFSDDGMRNAYVADEYPPAFHKQVILVDGKQQGSFEEISRPRMSRDGGLIAFTASSMGAWNPVTWRSGESGTLSDSTAVVRDGVRVSADGKRIIHIYAKKGTSSVTVGENGPEFDAIGDLVISKDASSIAYAARTSDGTWSVVLGEKKGDPYDEIRSIVFGKDEKTLIYAARKGKKFRIVAGDKTSDEFDAVGAPILSADGLQVGFGAVNGREAFWKVIRLK